MTVFFTSDLHLRHRKVAELRGHSHVDTHDNDLADTWRAQVRKDDVVWVLGDLAVSRPVAALELLASLPGRKRLVLGNHDKSHPLYRDAYRWHPLYADVFEWVTPSARTKVCGVEVVLSPFPYERDRGETRYQQGRSAATPTTTTSSPSPSPSPAPPTPKRSSPVTRTSPNSSISNRPSEHPPAFWLNSTAEQRPVGSGSRRHEYRRDRTNASCR